MRESELVRAYGLDLEQLPHTAEVEPDPPLPRGVGIGVQGRVEREPEPEPRYDPLVRVRELLPTIKRRAS